MQVSRAWTVLVALLASCSGESTPANRTPPPCAACIDYSTCASPGATESVSVKATDFTDSGCTAEVQSPSSGRFEIECAPLQVCTTGAGGPTACIDAFFDGKTLHWANNTCWR